MVGISTEARAHTHTHLMLGEAVVLPLEALVTCRTARAPDGRRITTGHHCLLL